MIAAVASIGLMVEFKRDALGLQIDVGSSLGVDDWELLARHHGLPTPILDWTMSPYVAAFFAFTDSASETSEWVSVWTFDREAFAHGSLAEIEVIDDIDRIQFNPRAIEQRGVFLRIGTTKKTIEQLLSQHLFRYDIPSSERQLALADLDQMLVNARTLFRDLDGAARSAAWRAMQED